MDQGRANPKSLELESMMDTEAEGAREYDESERIIDDDETNRGKQMVIHKGKKYIITSLVLLFIWIETY